MEEEKTLHIALVMAGAVSAGAYTGGVIDYLLEVLDAWEAAKADPQRKNEVPSHKVQIDVICGASAGGMTGAILASMAGEEHYPMTDENEKNNKFYNGWVNLSGKSDSVDILGKMLDVEDIKKNQKVTSALNSDFIDELADVVLSTKYTPKGNTYFKKDLDLLLTLTNTDGLNYNVSLGAGTANNTFVMAQHKDMMVFKLNTTYANDGKIPLHFDTSNNGKNDTNVDLLKNSAKATGAFPIGLKYRTFDRNAQRILDNSFFTYNENTEQEVKPNIEGNITSVFVDGGMMNNEPFELARKLLVENEQIKRKDGKDKDLETNANKFNATVLMIDPFPYEENASENSEKNHKDLDIFNMLGKLFSTLRGQALFEKDKLRIADKEDYSAFIIAPSKYIEGADKINGSAALACGALEGFSGFLHHSFRKHDFYLGRKNCKSFLDNHFFVSKNTENPIFKNGYKGLEEKYLTPEGDLPIIPQLHKIMNIAEPETLSPKVNFEHGIEAVKEKEQKIKERVKEIVNHSFVNDLIDGLPVYLKIFRGAIKNGLVKKVYKEMLEKIEKDLKALNKLHKTKTKT